MGNTVTLQWGSRADIPPERSKLTSPVVGQTDGRTCLSDAVTNTPLLPRAPPSMPTPDSNFKEMADMPKLRDRLHSNGLYPSQVSMS